MIFSLDSTTSNVWKAAAGNAIHFGEENLPHPLSPRYPNRIGRKKHASALSHFTLLLLGYPQTPSNQHVSDSIFSTICELQISLLLLFLFIIIIISISISIINIVLILVLLLLLTSFKFFITVCCKKSCRERKEAYKKTVLLFVPDWIATETE